MICIGHSHMICVLTAAQQAGVPFGAITLKAVKNERHTFGVDRGLLIEDRGRPDFGDEAKALLTKNDGPVYSFISGIQHVQLGLRPLSYPSEPHFDFVLPAAPDLPLAPAAEIVPVDVVREVLRAAFWSRMKILRRVCFLAPGRVVQFAPPPPAPDAWIETLAREDYGASAAPLPSGTVRWKLWRLTAAIFQENAQRFGARFVDYPPESVDEHGFMRSELVRNLSHGNAAFGALILKQINSLQ